MAGEEGLHALAATRAVMAQFFKTQRTVAARIDVDLFMVGKVRDRALKARCSNAFKTSAPRSRENLLVLADRDRRALSASPPEAAPSAETGRHVHLQLEPGDTHHVLQKMAQGLGRRLPVQTSIEDEFLSPSVVRTFDLRLLPARPAFARCHHRMRAVQIPLLDNTTTLLVRIYTAQAARERENHDIAAMLRGMNFIIAPHCCCDR